MAREVGCSIASIVVLHCGERQRKGAKKSEEEKERKEERADAPILAREVEVVQPEAADCNSKDHSQ
jgi:hypothetical protein